MVGWLWLVMVFDIFTPFLKDLLINGTAYLAENSIVVKPIELSLRSAWDHFGTKKKHQQNDNLWPVKFLRITLFKTNG